MSCEGWCGYVYICMYVGECKNMDLRRVLRMDGWMDEWMDVCLNEGDGDNDVDVMLFV